MQSDERKPSLLSDFRAAPQKLAEHPAKTISKRSCTINKHEFNRETSDEERFLLQQEICTALLGFLDRDIPVFLDGLGILYAVTSERLVQRALGEQAVIRSESHKSLEFEKCDRLCDSHREQFDTIAETKDLAQRIYPQLPVSLNVKWNEADTRRFIRGFIRSAKEQLLADGYSNLFDPVFSIYCLVHSSGSSLHDAFSGADIFIKSNYHQLLQVGPSRVYETPVLENAWELLEAAYGKPFDRFQIDVCDELRAMDFDLTEDDVLSLDLPPALRIAAFTANISSNLQTVLLCTDGLRNLAVGQELEYGNELTFQIEIARGDKIPHWVFQALSLGTLVVCSSQKKQIKPGLMMETEHALLSGKHCCFSGVLTTEFKPMPHVSCSRNGNFRYINLVGIEGQEIELAKKYSPSRVVTLLEHKKKDQITDPNRRPLLRYT